MQDIRISLLFNGLRRDFNTAARNTANALFQRPQPAFPYFEEFPVMPRQNMGLLTYSDHQGPGQRLLTPSDIFRIARSGDFEGALHAFDNLKPMLRNTYLSSVLSMTGHDLHEHNPESFKSLYRFLTELGPLTDDGAQGMIGDQLNKMLSFTRIPALQEAETIHDIVRVVSDIERHKLEKHIIDNGQIYGHMKMPTEEPLSLSEFAIYRLRSAHGSLEEMKDTHLLDLMESCLPIQKTLVDIIRLHLGYAEMETHLITDISTFTTSDNLMEAKNRAITYLP